MRGSFFGHASSRLRRCPRSLNGGVGVHQVCCRLLLPFYFCSLRSKGRSTKTSASVLPSSTPSVLSVSSQLPPSLPAKRLTKILLSDAASPAVTPSIPPLSPHIPLTRNFRLLHTLSGTSATHNMYTNICGCPRYE